MTLSERLATSDLCDSHDIEQIGAEVKALEAKLAAAEAERDRLLVDVVPRSALDTSNNVGEMLVADAERKSADLEKQVAALTEVAKTLLEVRAAAAEVVSERDKTIAAAEQREAGLVKHKGHVCGCGEVV